MQSTGGGPSPRPQKEGSVPRSRARPALSGLGNTTPSQTPGRQEGSSTHSFLGVWPCPHCGDSARRCGESSETQRQQAQRTQIHSNSHGIHTALASPLGTGSWQLSLRTGPTDRSQRRTRQRQLRGHLHAGERPSSSCPFKQAECGPSSDLKRPLQAPEFHGTKEA